MTLAEIKPKQTNMKYIPFLLLLFGCDDFAIFTDHRYKGTAILHVIEKGKKKSNDRSPSLVGGDGVKFNFNFQEVARQPDSSVHKVYGLSDSFEHHSKWSPRLGFWVREDSTVDIFAYWHMGNDPDKNFGKQWLGNISRHEWHYGAVEIEKNFYEFRFDEKIYRVNGRTKDWLWGLKYRLFPYYEDEQGHGAPGRISIMIEEI